MAVLGLRFCARAFSSCGKRGPLFIAVRGPLTVAASPVAEHRLQMRRLSSCGSRAQLLRGHVGSSQTRAGTRVPCIGRQILNHCATREALWIYFLWLYYYKVLGNFLIYEGLSATKKTSWFQNPSIFKIYLLISNGTGWVSWEENSEMEIKCAESLLGDQHPQERVKQGVKEYFSYLAGREILCEAVTTMIQKILKGFKSWESLVELC